MSEVDDNRSELVDEDVIEGEYPPEEPLGVDERLTPAEEQIGESVATRKAREDRDALDAGEDDAFDDDDEDDDDLAYDDEDLEVGRVGPLVAPGGDEGEDLEADEVAIEAARYGGSAWDMTQDREEVLSAEEAAMHLTEDPPMGDGDGYID